ncbi:MAG TPA: HAD-IIA family hydrolase [Thermoflexia bacterium]|nr:HAD-IIA family hydrolase [Thermoflexia bacterium]
MGGIVTLKNRVAAIILAAGGSTRFGQSKQLLDWGGRSLLAHVTDVALSAGLDPVVVVLGCRGEDVRAVLGKRSVRCVMNWRWEDGMSTSVQAGLAALPPETEAAIFLQCDQPLVTPELLRVLVGRFEETGASIVHPTRAGRRGTPVLFARGLFPELACVSGDEGGRSIIARYPDEVAAVEVSDPDTLSDIDTPKDYERLLAARHSVRPQRSQIAIRNLHHLIIDMDGVLWRGDEPMDGLQEFFAFLRQNSIDFILATNNSSRTPEQYVAKLARFGVEVPAEHVLTSAQATAAYLATVAPPGARVYTIGGEGLRRALEQRSFVLADEDAAYVVVGWDRQLTWDKLATAALLIHAGAEFIGTNPDVNYPTERGPVPGCGAQLAALEVTTGVAPVVIGKPEAWMYEEALRRMGAHSESTAMLGDRLDTDIVGAARAGLMTVLLLSGISTEADLAASLLKPDLVCADIGELVRAWKDPKGFLKPFGSRPAKSQRT